MGPQPCETEASGRQPKEAEMSRIAPDLLEGGEGLGADLLEGGAARGEEPLAGGEQRAEQRREELLA